MDPNEINLGGLVGDVGNLDSGLSKLIKSVDVLLTKFTKLSGTSISGAALHSFAGGIGQLDLGDSGSGNILSGSLGTLSSGYMSATRKSMVLGVAGGLLKGFGGALAGFSTALPNVNTAMGMAQGEYFGAVMGSDTTWGAVGRQTLRGIAGGTNIAGAPGVISASLASQGIYAGNTSGLYGGAAQYNNILSSIKGAATYLNIPNDAAAKSIGGLYSGSTSMNMLQNFGIYTTNPGTGKSASPLQMFAMLNDRMTGGGNMSYKQVKTALGPGGLLSADIQNSGLDDTQQTMLRKYMLDAAKGDYWNSKTYGTQFAKAAGGNPVQSQMTVLTAQTKTMQTAAKEYVTGMQKATKAIVGFEHALDHFLHTPMGKMMAQAQGAGNLAMSDPAVQGAVTSGLSAINSISDIANTISNFRGAKNLGKKLNLWGKNAGKEVLPHDFQGPLRPNQTRATETIIQKMANSGKFGKFLASSSKFLSKAEGPLGALMSALPDIQQGNYGGAAGSGAGAWIGGALGALVPIPGLDLLTAAGGSWLGSTIGESLGTSIQSMFSGGSDGTVSQGTRSNASGALKLSHPVYAGAKIGTRFGQKDKLHPSGHHGVDFQVSIGTPVQAAAAGTVTYSGGNAQNTMGTNNRTLGLQVIIDHGQGYSTVYGHLSATAVSVGTKVTVGQQIGSSGNSGYSTGAHLHFELRKNGTPIDPSQALGSNYSALTVGGSSASASSTGGDYGGGTSAVGSSAQSLGYNSGAGYNGGSMPSAYGGASIGKVATTIAAMGSTVNGVGGKQNAGGSSIGSGSGGGADTAPVGRSGPVTINLNVQSASEAEARRMAQIIKDYLEQDKLALSMRTL